MLPADHSPSFELLQALYMLEKEKYSRSSLLAPMLKRMPWLQLVNGWICQIGSIPIVRWPEQPSQSKF